MTCAVRDARPMLIRGGGVITMDPRLGDLQKADILLCNGVIQEVAASIAAHEAEVIDARAMIVMPGFIDGHRHLWEGVIRNTLPTEDLEGYLRLVNNGFAQAYSPEDAYIGTLVSALGALDSGVTAIFDWAHIQTTPEHTQATLQALRDSGLRTVFGFGPPGRQDRGHQWPQDLLRLQREEFASEGPVTLALAGLSPEHVPYEMAKAQFELARNAGVMISAHAALNGMGEPGQIERFGREGLLGPHVNLVHCNTLNAVEWRMMADSGVSVSITPMTEMQMGQGRPPIQAALDAGIKPSVGVDVETSTPGDLWTQMRIIYSLQRSQAFEVRYAGGKPPRMLDLTDLLELVTTAGAHCIGLGSKVGSISPGKRADLVLLRCDLLNVMPVNDMKSAVALNMDARNVDTVLIDGRVVKRNGQMMGVDVAAVAARLYQSRERVFRDAQIPCKSPRVRYPGLLKD